MPPRMGKLQSVVQERAQSVSALVRANRFWFATGTITVLLMGSGFLSGHAALQRSRDLYQEQTRLEGVLDRVDGWIRSYRPASPQETLVWRRSEQVLTELGQETSDPAAVASLLTSRAEALGISDLRIGFAQDSTAAAPEPRTSGDWTLQFQPPSLEVEFTGDFAALLAFVDALPPHTEVGSLSVGRRDDGVTARLIVNTFRPQR